MNRHLLSLSIAFLTGMNGFAQDNSGHKMFTMNMGLSIPTGAYGSKNFDNTLAGYAMPGFLIDLTYQHEFHPNLGFTAMGRSMAHSMNDFLFEYDFANYLKKNSAGSNPIVYIGPTVYSIGGLMAGMYGDFSWNQKIQFEPRMLIGFSVATLPGMITDAYNSTTLVTTTVRETASTFCFSYLIGMGFKMNLGTHSFLHINLDTYGANARWNDVRYISAGYASSTIQNRKFDYFMNFRTLNLSAGFGLKF